MVLALGAVGVGYAAFTGALNITGSVSSGTMKAAYYGNQVFYAPTHVGVTVTPDGNDPSSVSVSLTNLAPGDEVIVGLAVQNSGSLPWVMRNFAVSNVNDYGSGLAPYCILSIPTNDENGPDHWATMVPVPGQLTGPATDLISWQNIYSPYDLNTLPALVQNQHVMPTVDPTHWLAIYADLKLDPSAGDSLQGKTVTFTITLTELLPQP